MDNSREIFKGYIQIGILRFMCFMVLSYFNSILGDFQMSWQGYIFGYTLNYIFYGLSRPVTNLSKIIVDDDFFGIHTLISMVLSLQLLVFSGQLVVVLRILQNSPNYIPTTQLLSNGNLTVIGQKNTIMFITVLVDYLYIYLILEARLQNSLFTKITGLQFQSQLKLCTLISQSLLIKQMQGFQTQSLYMIIRQKSKFSLLSMVLE
ncbi:hypothetical protein ABPG72_017897 [Tetrahymena utriculariae]